MRQLRLSDKNAALLWRGCGVLALVAFALTLRARWFGVSAFDAVFYRAVPAASPGPLWFILAALIAAAVVGAFGKLEACGKAFAPALLLYPLLLPPPSFPILAATLAVTGWCLYRASSERSLLPSPPKNAAVWLAAALSLAAALWSFTLQERAYRSLFLAYQDWGEYAECYLALARGGVPWRAYLAQAGHFNFLPNVVMSLLLRLHREPETIFAVSALLSGSLPFLSYLLAREHRLPAGGALLCALAAALNPVLVNQSLSFFYGFHPVLFQGPLLLGFFIMAHRRNKIGMAAFFILSMLVQETAAVLWFGGGLYLLTRRRYLAGTLLATGCVAYFLIVTNLGMRFVHPGVTNPQMFHYSRLGDTPLEVLLSPFLRPGAFLSTLFDLRNWYFTAALALPFMTLFDWKKLVFSLPLWAGVVMQSSPDVKNPSMQYGFELTVLGLAFAIQLAGKKLEDGEATSRVRAGLRGMAAMALLCSLFYARLPIGKYSAAEVFAMPDATATLEFLRDFAADGSRMIATKRLRSHFMFDLRTAPPDAERQTGDTVILDLGEKMEPVDVFRRELVADERAIPVSSKNFYGRQFAVWRIAPPGTPRPKLPFLREIGEAEFSRLGVEIPQNDPAFSARLVRTPRGSALLLIRLRERADHDVEINLSLRRNGRATTRRLYFGDGVYPAYCARPGEVYLTELPGAFPDTAALELSARR